MLFCCERNAHVKIFFNKNIVFKKQGVCVSNDDIYFNYNTKKE